MGKVYNNGISTATGLFVDGNTPVDDRLVVQLISDLHNLNKYDGLITKVQEDGLYYSYDLNSDSWSVFQSGSSTSNLQSVLEVGSTASVATRVDIETSDNINLKGNIVQLQSDVAAISVESDGAYIGSNGQVQVSGNTTNINGYNGLYISAGASGTIAMNNPSNGVVITGNAGGVVLNGSTNGVSINGGSGPVVFNAPVGITFNDITSYGFSPTNLDDLDLVHKSYLVEYVGTASSSTPSNLQSVLEVGSTASVTTRVDIETIDNVNFKGNTVQIESDSSNIYVDSEGAYIISTKSVGVSGNNTNISGNNGVYIDAGDSGTIDMNNPANGVVITGNSGGIVLNGSNKGVEINSGIGDIIFNSPANKIRFNNNAKYGFTPSVIDDFDLVHKKYVLDTIANATFSVSTAVQAADYNPVQSDAVYNYLVNNYLPLVGGTVSGTFSTNKLVIKTGATGSVIFNSNLVSTTQSISLPNGSGTLPLSVNGVTANSSGNIVISGAGTASWGAITGTLSNQTDLQNALNLKMNVGTNSFLSSTQSRLLLTDTNGSPTNSNFLTWNSATREVVIGATGAGNTGRINIYSQIFQLSVQDNITSGNATILFNSGQQDALSFKDKNGLTYMTFTTITGNTGVVIKNREVFDESIFYPVSRRQASIASAGAGVKVYAKDSLGATFSIPFATDTMTALFEVGYIFKNSTSSIVISGKYKALAKRVGGTITVTSGTLETITNNGTMSYIVEAEGNSNNSILLSFTPNASDSTTYTGAFGEIKYIIN